jgi:hypothetical protein
MKTWKFGICAFLANWGLVALVVICAWLMTFPELVLGFGSGYTTAYEDYYARIAYDMLWSQLLTVTIDSAILTPSLLAIMFLLQKGLNRSRNRSVLTQQNKEGSS